MFTTWIGYLRLLLELSKSKLLFTLDFLNKQDSQLI